MPRRRRYSQDSGSEFARRHVEEARRFSNEMGGTDEDVKAYFFSLEKNELEKILTAYGMEFGEKAEQYARTTMPKWRSGGRRMSGLVAKRLFGLLPPRMPTAKKFELAENIWKHFGPASNSAYRIGPHTEVNKLTAVILAKLDDVVTSYNIPQNVKNRFDWLSAGDVGLKEQLLNHFRQMEKELAAERTRLEIPVLQRQASKNAEVTGLLKTVLQIHKHSIEIFVMPELEDQILEGAPASKSNSKGFSGWWVIIAIAAVIAYLMAQ